MDDWPLVGRGEELAVVLNELRKPGTPAVVVAGAAGVGKTRLAREAARALEADGWRIKLVVGSDAAATIPFGAVAVLLPVAGPEVTPIDVLTQARAALRGDEHDRTLLVVDDAHRLDPGSATVVQQVVSGGVCAVLGTVRSGETAPDAVASLWKDGWAERVELQALSRIEVGDLLVRVLGATVDASTIRLLYEASRGNVLYLRELVESARGAGRLRLIDGVWHLEGRPTAPPQLLELIDARLTGLDADVAGALDVLAVAEQFPLEQLRALGRAEAFERLEAEGLAEVRSIGGRPCLSLAHPLYGEAVRARLPALRRERVDQELADALEGERELDGPDLVRVVLWRLGSRQPQDPERIQRAARHAFIAHDLALAGELATAARAAGAGFDAGLVEGEVAMLTGASARAEELFAALTREASSDDDLARVANARAYNLANQLDQYERADAVLGEALASLQSPSARIVVANRLGVSQAQLGDPEAALVTLGPVVEGAEGSTFESACYGTGLALGFLGRLDECLATGDMARARRPDGAAARQVAAIHDIGPIIALVAAGEFADAAGRAAQGLESTVEVGDTEGQATFGMLSGIVALERGEAAAAASLFREATVANRALGDGTALRWTLAGAALAGAFTGDGGGAELLAEVETTRGGRVLHFELALIARAQAWVAAATGETTRAAAVLGAAADEARARNHPVAEVVLRHDRVRLGAAAAEAARLVELAQVVQGDLAAARAADADSRRTGSPDELCAAAKRLFEIGAMLLAAETAAVASRSFRAAGLARRAGVCDEIVRKARAASGGAVSPLFRGADAPTPLTAREREIAVLASQGIATKEIAERLFLSPRTVDNHLQRIFVKLGISTRADLHTALD